MEKYRLNKEDVCLLVIDVQEKLVPIMKHGKAIIKNTQILLQGAKEMGIPVIATEQYPKGLGSTVAASPLSAPRRGCRARSSARRTRLTL